MSRFASTLSRFAPGFAFAHSRPSPAVQRTGMSWVRLARPVEFGHDRNDPVDLVVALAATDATAHTRAMAELAKVIGDPQRRAALEAAPTADAVYEILGGTAASATPPAAAAAEPARRTTNKILTVCGNGLGTSLFLKNTLEQVLDRWGWSSYCSSRCGCSGLSICESACSWPADGGLFPPRVQ